ncbi:hypothetical protein Ddye_032325 [Dipteronia dyeriana]|uniref:Uncharacterized protein n=1 Tax=Dipteronia dyeriana TaxID=168575 RepID=A0AAD9WPE7_9ROSI|nr:hypothetical protein Ddye_032325 [Dipteronia dyeriana]
MSFVSRSSLRRGRLSGQVWLGLARLSVVVVVVGGSCSSWSSSLSWSLSCFQSTSKCQEWGRRIDGEETIGFCWERINSALEEFGISIYDLRIFKTANRQRKSDLENLGFIGLLGQKI